MPSPMGPCGGDTVLHSSPEISVLVPDLGKMTAAVDVPKGKEGHCLLLTENAIWGLHRESYIESNRRLVKIGKAFTDIRSENSALGSRYRVLVLAIMEFYWDLLRNHLPWDSHTTPSSLAAEATSGQLLIQLHTPYS